jgi:hypothetical protein
VFLAKIGMFLHGLYLQSLATSQATFLQAPTNATSEWVFNILHSFSKMEAISSTSQPDALAEAGGAMQRIRVASLTLPSQDEIPIRFWVYRFGLKGLQ